MRSTKRTTLWLVAASAAVAAAVAGVGLAGASTGRPAASHRAIVTNRASARAGSWITVTGSGFRPGSRLVLRECSARFWIVPLNPCSGETVQVRAGANGGFTARLRAQACPALFRAGTGRSGLCYIGVPAVRGVDTEVLRFAVPITVTKGSGRLMA